MSKIVDILSHQSIFDIAVQYTGKNESAFIIALANDISMTESLSTDSILIIPDDTDKNKGIISFFEIQENKPGTAITTEQYRNTISGEGIEFWAIEEDFMVN